MSSETEAIRHMLGVVLPEEPSNYRIFLSSGNTKRVEPIATIQDMVDAIDRANRYGTDAYFLLGSMKDSDGTTKSKDNVDKIRSFWLDIDVEGSKKGYDNVDKAIENANSFFEQLRIPLPYILKSGRGIHVLTPMVSSTSRTNWEVAAKLLVKACHKFGLNIDASVTTNCAGHPRLPGTFNYKGSSPIRVEICQTVVSPIAFSDLLSILTNYVGNLKENKTSTTKDTDTKPIASHIIKLCPQIANQTNASYDVWMGMLSVISKCENGDYECHQLSSMSSTYNKKEVDDKLADMRARDFKPFTCEYFEKVNQSGCMGCKYKDVIISPIKLGFNRKTESVMRPTLLGEVVHSIPKFSTTTFELSDKGCIQIKKDKEGGVIYNVLYEYPIYPLLKEIIADERSNYEEQIVWRVHKANGRFKDVTLGALSDPKTMKTLQSAGVYTVDRNADIALEKYMRLILKKRLEELEETNMVSHLGWQENKQTGELVSYALGDCSYNLDGTTSKVKYKSGILVDRADATMPKGTLERWKMSASVYNYEGLEWAQTVVCGGFAAPLMRLGAVERAASLSVFGQKGDGKTQAQKIALAIFGNPNKLLHGRTTHNKMFNIMGLDNSIAVAVDEMSETSPKIACDIAYTVTGGTEKGRMTQDVRNEWSTLVMMSSNKSLYNIMSSHSADASAQMSRILEVRTSSASSSFDKRTLLSNREKVSYAEYNYGHAGKVFIRHILSHLEEVKLDIIEYESKLYSEYGFMPTDRFMPYIVARLYIACKIAVQLELVSYDVKRLETFLIASAQRATAHTSSYVVDNISAIGDFLNSHKSSILIVRSNKRSPLVTEEEYRIKGASADSQYILQDIVGNNLSVRISFDDNVVYIAKSKLKSWCERNNMSLNEVINDLTSGGMYKGTIKTNLGAHTIHKLWSSRVEAIVLDKVALANINLEID